MVTGETTKRSELDAAHLVERLQAAGVEQLRGEDEVWAIVDPSELRKPYAKALPDLMRVRKLHGEGTVPGYRTLTVLGVGTGGRRGILYHHLFSSQAADFASESREIQTALASVGAALASRPGQVTYVMDSQFDDIAVWGTIWAQGNHLVCRLKHLERRLEREAADDTLEAATVADVRGATRAVARFDAELLVRKRNQRTAKRQPVRVVVSAAPVQVRYRADARSAESGPEQTRRAWVVVVQLEHVAGEPWVLLTDWPVETAAEAQRIFRLYRMRWAIEDCFKFTKEAFGWEDVQVMDLAGIRTLVALAWVAAGFLYQLGVTFDWPELTLLGRLGGWTPRPNRPPGKVVLARGLRRLLDYWATAAFLQDTLRRDGALPRGIAALLGDACPAAL